MKVLQRAKILLVEDDDDLREVLSVGLRRARYDVRALPDGSDILVHFNSFEPDLIVTDIIMPNKEGIGLINELRKVSPSIPIIAMSGGGRLGASEVLGYASALRVQRTLRKPFPLSELTEAISEELAVGLP